MGVVTAAQGFRHLSLGHRALNQRQKPCFEQSVLSLQLC
jgi:hypothetical protein